MKKRLFLSAILILAMGLLSFFMASIRITRTNNQNLARDMVIEAATICADLYQESSELASFVQAGNETRITVISPEGAVLADSRPLDMATLENHLDRPEIRAAADGSPAAFVRYSDSVGINYIYYALKVPSDDSYVFIRTAVPVAKIDLYLTQSLPVLVFLLIAVAALCFILTRATIIRITKPFASVEQKLRLLSSGEYSPEPAADSYEEIDTILRRINEIAGILQKSLSSLQEEKSKLNYILNSIGDGLFVVNDTKNIMLINSVSLAIFDATPDILGKKLNYLSYEKALTLAVDDCVIHEKSAFLEMMLNGRCFFVTVKRLPDTNLTMVVLSDITEARDNAKRREVFFANASHELKTPLTAIKGFNELMAIQNQDNEVRKYIDGIARETDRMLTLIDDMLKLSELENTQNINPVPVSLANMAEEVSETMSAAIAEKSIQYENTGDGVVLAEPAHVYELIKNLVENAIRYNSRGGRVSVTIESDGRRTRLSVFDNGIGISPEEQTRIFERFYRVEKSRSQRNGGTGLGLSIVKHICALYNWNLSLKSKPGIGTEIIIEFETQSKSAASLT